VAAFTAPQELKAYLRRRLETFVNPLVYTLWGNQGPSIMTMSSAQNEGALCLDEYNRLGQSGRARMGIARALKGPANYCREDEAPRVQAARHLRRTAEAMRRLSLLKNLSDHRGCPSATATIGHVRKFVRS
jgi:hypothetical protein